MHKTNINVILMKVRSFFSGLSVKEGTICATFFLDTTATVTLEKSIHQMLQSLLY